MHQKKPPPFVPIPPDEVVLTPHRSAQGVTYWAPMEPRDEPSLIRVLLELMGLLLLLGIRIVWRLFKWALVIAFYAALFGFFLLFFGALLAL